MYKVDRYLFISLLIAIISLSSAWADTMEIVQDNLSKVVMIITFDLHDHPLAIGSGFYISSDGKIATNYHVIEGAARAIVKEIGSDKKILVDSVVQMDAEHDIAIIKINKDTETLKLGRNKTLVVGEKVVAIGNPNGFEGIVSEGIVNGFRSVNEDFSMIQITAPISPGCSGGPLFNSAGEVVGMATTSVVSGKNFNFAVPVSALHNFISKGPLNIRLNQVDFPLLAKRKTVLSDSRGTELVSVVDHSYFQRVSLDFSIFNGSQYNISDVKLIVIFYKYEDGYKYTCEEGVWEKKKDRFLYHEGVYPVHYEVYEIKDVIPSGFSKWFTRRVGAYGHWIADFRVLDYNILPSSRRRELR